MDIRFISSLTAEDEDVFAPAVLKAVSVLLDQLPIAYTLRIETTRAQVYQHTHATAESSAKAEHAPAPAAAPGGGAPIGPRSEIDGAFLRFFARE